MESAKFVIAVILLGLLHTCCATQAILQLSADNTWELENTIVRCYLDDDTSNRNISQVSLYKSDSLVALMEVTKPCDSLLVNTTSDTTNGRISYNDSAFNFENLTLLDTGSYACSFVRCSSPDQVLLSNNATLTVHRPNTQPVLSVAQNGTTINENDTITLTLTCSGYVGYPPGTMSLVFVSSTSSSIVIKNNMTYDSNGYASESVNYTNSYQFVYTENYFYCESFKTNSVTSYLFKSSIYELPVEYAPRFLAFAYSGGKLGRNQIVRTLSLPKPGLYTILCWTNSLPDPALNFTQID